MYESSLCSLPKQKKQLERLNQELMLIRNDVISRLDSSTTDADGEMFRQSFKCIPDVSLSSYLSILYNDKKISRSQSARNGMAWIHGCRP